MKKFYLTSLLMAAFATLSMAQVDVTLSIDMNGQTVGENGVHVAGAFATSTTYGDPVNTQYVNWSPSAIELLDADGNGIYEVTLSLMPGNYEYKMINGNDWPQEELIPAACQVDLGMGNANRFFDVVEGEPMTISHAFGKCGALDKTTVHFRVDMANIDMEDPDFAPAISGDFSDFDFIELSQWRGTTIYAALVDLDLDVTSTTFGFSTDGSFVGYESFTEGDCLVDGARLLTIENVGGDILNPLYCFDACESCVDPIMVTFTVDMSNVTVSELGVHVAGSFQGWNPGGTPLSDNGDGTWSVTLPVEPGSYGYKFVNGNAWGFDESVPGACAVDNNRSLVITAEDSEVTMANCFGQCAVTCVADPDPATITFRVDMNAEVVEESGVFVMGMFTTPQWQAGRLQMTDADADGIYEVDALVSGAGEIQFKFSNGDPQLESFTDGEFTVGENPGDCTVSNGFGNFNRAHVRSGEDEVVGFVYNTCNIVVGISEFSKLEGVKAFPNPMNENLTLSFENTGVHQITITDVTGKLVRSYNNVNQPVFEIYRGSLQSGLYIMQIVNEKREAASIKLLLK